MKLSEAMKVGFRERPNQCYGVMTDEDGGVCALGAAFVGLIGNDPKPGQEAYDLLIETFPVLRLQEVQCPKCILKPMLTRGGGAWEIVVHLNDTHGASREEIVAWVEQIEQQPEPAAV